MSLIRMMFSVVCCSCACVLASVSHGQADDASSATDNRPCSSCASDGGGDPIANGELRDLMIEHIKKQILRKLRMTAPPHVTKPAVIPEVLLKNHLLEESGGQRSLDMGFSRDDYYGRAEEVVIFPENTSTHNCYGQEEERPNSCFLFRLTNYVTARSVSSAELWVYAVDNSSFPSNITYTVSEMVLDPRGNGDNILERVVAIKEVSSSGWIKFEMGPAVRTWSHRYHLTHAIQISCVGCDPTVESPVSVEEGQKPFLIIHTKTWQRGLSRSKRSLTCREGMTTCCKENFKLYFKDIGWNDWIIAPLVYDANFCRGSCLVDVSNSRYHHTTAIRNYIQRRGHDNSSVNVCCVASRMLPLNIVHLDVNSVITKVVLPNMIVESCDCI